MERFEHLGRLVTEDSLMDGSTEEGKGNEGRRGGVEGVVGMSRVAAEGVGGIDQHSRPGEM